MSRKRKASSVATLRYYKNQTKVGKQTAAKSARSVYYYAYGLKRQVDGEGEELRGMWYGPHGRVSHKQVMAWTEAQALEHKYTYTAVLSVREGQLRPEDYLQAMVKAGQVQDWRLIQHQDTDHDHAHVIFFADKTWSQKVTRQWNRVARQELESVQLERQQKQQAQQQRRQGLEL